MSSSKRRNKVYAEHARKESRIENEKKLQAAIESILGAYLDQKYQDDETQFENHYSDIYQFIKEKSTNNFWKIRAHQFFKKFVTDKNKNREESLPIPFVPFLMQRDALVRNAEWFKHGHVIDEIIAKLWDYWILAKNKESFSDDEIIANILVSAMLYSGLNHEQSLKALLEYLKNPDHTQCIEYMNIIFLEPLSPGYGDLFIDEKTIRKSRNFIPDHITRLWLIHFNTRQIKEIKCDARYYLELILRKISFDFNHKTYKLLRDYSNFNWTQLDSADIDPALSECLTENILTCGLSEHAFKNFYAPQFFQTKQYQEESRNMPAAINQILAVSGDTLKNTLKIHKDLLKFIRVEKTEHEVVDQIIEYVTSNKDKLNEHCTRIILWLISLYKPNASQVATLLVKLGVDQVKFEKSFQENNPLSDGSIYTYYTRIAEPWLSHSLQHIHRDEDINSTLNGIYEQIITNTRIANDANQTEFKKSKAQVIQMLKRFHKFQQMVFQADAFAIETITAQIRPRARIIGHQTFRLLINTLEQMNAENLIKNAQYQYLRIIFTLAYRTGMRINEILGLRVRDIEGLDLLSIWIQPYGSKKQGNQHQLKTDSSQRNLPIYCLLKKDEYILFHQYIVEIRLSKSKNDYVFCEWNSISKLSKNAVTMPLNRLLDRLIKNHDYSFHSLRHSAANHFALVLNCEYSPWVEKLTDYTLDEYNNIRQEILQNKGNQNRWFIIAHLLGHIEPTETFKSYIHLSYLIAGTKLLKYQPNITTELAMKMMGYEPTLPSFKFLEPVNLAKPFDFQRHAHDLSKLLSHQLNTWSRSNFDDVFIDPSLLNKKPHDYFDYFAGTPQSKVSFKVFYQCLTRLEILRDAQQVASEFSLPIELVDHWLKNAQKIASLKTRKGSQRLFDVKHSSCLKPARVNTKEEKVIYEFFFDKLQGQYEQNSSATLKVLDLFLERITTTHSGIHFPHKQLDQLEEFYNTLHNLFPSEHWNLTGSDLAKSITRKNHPMLFKLMKSQKITPSQTHDNYVRLQLVSQKNTRALGVFKFCLHLACIGMPGPV